MKLRWQLALVLSVLSLTVTPSRAADDAGSENLEVGAQAIAVSVGENDTTSASFGNLSQGLYFQWFATARLGIEPAVGMAGLWTDNTNSKNYTLSARVNFYLLGKARHSPFLYAAGEASYIGGEIKDLTGVTASYHRTWPSLELGAGYRFVIRRRVSLRLEGAYVRQFDDWGTADGQNSFKFATGFGVRF